MARAWRKPIMKVQNDFSELDVARVLLVDDDSAITGLVAEMLTDRIRMLFTARTCGEARAAAKKDDFDVALVDVNLPDGNGFDLIKKLKENGNPSSFIVITGQADATLSGDLDRMGVQTLLVKPFTRSQLAFCICRELFRDKKRQTKKAFPSENGERDNALIGVSPYIEELREKIADLAAGAVPVLINGPTGTGKEIIARSIHEQSGRRGRPMITVNSSAIPEHLEESEFFGYAKGAFTGANQAKDGILKCADESTLFLDEVGELSVRMQAKLLRVLDGNEFSRIGETSPQQSDFRLISATNRPLREMIAGGAFREDLFFRLRAATIVTQPLIKHKEDIPILIDHFLKRIAEEKNIRFEISQGAFEAIENYTWPGNVRELKNAIESLCTISQKSGVISRDSVLWAIGEAGRCETEPTVPFSAAKVDFEREYYRALLMKFNGAISAAARAAGIERAYFSKRVRALGLTKETYRLLDGSGQKTTQPSGGSIIPLTCYNADN